MIGHGRPCTHCVACCILFLVAVTTGCASTRAKKSEPQPEPKRIAMRPMAVESPEAHRAQAAPNEDRQKATLDAVEQFLARTKEYRIDDSSHTSTPIRSEHTAPKREKLPVPQSLIKPEIVSSEIVSKEANRTEHRLIANTEISLKGAAATTSVPSFRSVTIRPKKPQLTPTMDATDVVGTTNKPLQVVANDQALSVDRFLQALKKSAHDDGSFEAAWRYRIVEHAFGRKSAPIDDRILASSNAVPLLTSILGTVDAVHSLAGNPLDSGERALEAVTHLRELVAEKAEPVVDAIAFCRRVVTFGVYDEMGSDEFVAGRSISTIVYSEIRNLSSERAVDGSSRTEFASRIEAFTDGGQSVWRHEEPEIVDRCRRRRNDFFVAQRITLPPTLAPGKYVLKVFIEDKLTGKASEATREFLISPQDTLTARR